MKASTAKRILFVIWVWIGSSASVANSCSTFYIPGVERPVFGKNYDWSLDVGLVVVNKRGVSKAAMASGSQLTWTSKYGSVTFNQYGRELPSGGMNEAGLIVELLWLDNTEYPTIDERPAIGNVQWIQYQLDNCATVDEVIATDASMRIVGSSASKVHYLVADRSGNRAAIECIGGRMVHHKSGAAPVSALTNHTYDESIRYLEQHERFGGSRPIAKSTTSLDRFVNAVSMAQRFDPRQDGSPVDYAFGVLQSVAQGTFTKWSIVYDVRGAVVHFKTLANPRHRMIDLKKLDFSCASAVRVLDINADLFGDVTDDLVEYERELNRKVIEKAFRNTPFLKDIPADILDRLSRYPEGTTCHSTAGRD